MSAAEKTLDKSTPDSKWKELLTAQEVWPRAVLCAADEAASRPVLDAAAQPEHAAFCSPWLVRAHGVAVVLHAGRGSLRPETLEAPGALRRARHVTPGHANMSLAGLGQVLCASSPPAPLRSRTGYDDVDVSVGLRTQPQLEAQAGQHICFQCVLHASSVGPCTPPRCTFRG